MNTKIFEPVEVNKDLSVFRKSRLGGDESNTENIIMDRQDG